MNIEDIKNLTIWGNHSTTQVPDYCNAIIDCENVISILKEDTWIQETFIQMIQKRGYEIIKKRKKSSAASVANAIIDTIKPLYSKEEESFSLGLCSDNNPYGITIFSFSCVSDGCGNVKIVQDVTLNDFLKKK